MADSCSQTFQQPQDLFRFAADEVLLRKGQPGCSGVEVLDPQEQNV